MMFRFGPALLGLVALFSFGPVALARAGTSDTGTVYEWLFHQYLSDGAGGFTGPALVDSGSQTDGLLSEEVTLGLGGGPHAEVFSSEGATEIWGFARSPFSGGAEDDPIGSRAELRVTQIFRKDASDATLGFTIPQSELSVFHAFGPDNEGFSGILVHVVEAGDFFAFFEQATLSGVGGAWSFDDSGELPFEITQGGLDESSVTFAFSEPYVRDIDLSSLVTGQEFAVQYRVIADALDTVQSKSNIRVFGRDPADEADGVTFEFTGLTPIPAPEPGAALLLVAGAAVLWGLARRRA
jgi:hypothetical protein